MNKNISQLLQQLAGIWKQLGLNQRISIALATLAVLGGLAGVALWSSRPEFSLLYGKLDEGEAAKVIAALDEAKVPYQISRGGGAILVPADKVYQVRMQMAGKGIPRGEGVGFEIFDKANFGISDFVQRANYTRAVQGELARTISQLDQVESAPRHDRHAGEPPPHRRPAQAHRLGLCPRQRRRPVALLRRQFHPLPRRQQRRGACKSTMFPSWTTWATSSPKTTTTIPSPGLSNNQLAARRNFEQYLSKKAEGMLEQVLGPGQAVVRVSAEINWDTTTRTEEKFDPDGQVARTTTSTTRTPIPTPPPPAALPEAGPARRQSRQRQRRRRARRAGQQQPHPQESHQQQLRNQQDHQQRHRGGRRFETPLHRRLRRAAL